MMLRANLSIIAVAAFVFAAHAAALAADPSPMDAELRPIESEWARITYQVTDGDEKEKQLQGLADAASGVTARYPNRAEPIIWEGVIASSEARYAGPFGALGFAKRARDLFEKAGRLDYSALDGAVPTSLGALYYMVPGFPLGFGDNGKARRYLEQGVEISPRGLDSNFFYGDFLYRTGQYGKAAAVLKQALDAPADRERPVWDAGRRAEIRMLLAKVDQKLASER
jgi:tetratricopeptide (TPR) repeat protein